MSEGKSSGAVESLRSKTREFSCGGEAHPNFVPSDFADVEVQPWFLAYTKPKHEHVAYSNLKMQAYQAYLPLFKVLKKAGKDSALDADPTTFEPMFSRYVFFRPGSSRQSIAGARSTRGVNSIVCFGFEPATVQALMLDAVRLAEQERNRATIDEISPFQAGRQVRLRALGLQGLQGLVQSVSGKRVTLLLEILGRQKLVKVQRHEIELI